MTDNPRQHGEVPDEMSEFLQIFMDETDEQLEGLTETLLVLEKEPDSAVHLNEAFRLIHSIKGAAGMMGLDSITALTHHLESRFERLRSGAARLDESMMNLVLRCIDFLRECVNRLRTGQPLGSSGELLQALSNLGDDTPSPGSNSAAGPAAVSAATHADVAAATETGEGRHLVVRFEPGLPLVDLKARLILSRLSKLGDIVTCRPGADDLDGVEDLSEFEVVLVTDQDSEAIRAAAHVDGIEAVELDGACINAVVAAPAPPPVPALEPPPEADAPSECALTGDPAPAAESVPAPPAEVPAATTTPARVPADRVGPAEKPKLAETMRVDIERLDGLLNLAGELVVNRARFVQLARQVTPAFGRRQVTSRMRDFGETLRSTIEHLMATTNGATAADIEGLRAGLDLLEEQTQIWDRGRRGFGQIGEAIDQLTRISDSLQQSVLDTRMVPVAPLFSRFKRVVRDLSSERGKKVNLLLRGEKTELDKRMMDELGDPLVHLVRNAIDHGLEAPDVRQSRGKPQDGTIVLEARHSGNNVFIYVRDDGNGINVARIRSKIVERGLLSATAEEELTDAQALDYIWHAGFSTAQEVTDVSGRGVGMDAVKTRIDELNGRIDVECTPEEGTTFTIRLPLTLAIINSLLIRVRETLFSIPIEDVREIVAVQPSDVVAVHGKQTIDVRGTFIPLVGIEDVFDWRDLDHGAEPPRRCESDGGHAVILQAGDRTMGLRVDELIGSQDVVIKSLSENFVHIRGLSGASIMGDGGVCLMLDVPTVMELVIDAITEGHA